MAVNFDELKKQLAKDTGLNNSSPSTTNNFKTFTVSDIENIKANARLKSNLEKINNIGNEYNTYNTAKNDFYNKWQNPTQSFKMVRAHNQYYRGLKDYLNELKASEEDFKLIYGEDGYNKIVKNVQDSISRKANDAKNISTIAEYYGAFNNEDEYKRSSYANEYKNISTVEEYEKEITPEKIKNLNSDEKSWLQGYKYALEYWETENAIRDVKNQIYELTFFESRKVKNPSDIPKNLNPSEEALKKDIEKHKEIGSGVHQIKVDALKQKLTELEKSKKTLEENGGKYSGYLSSIASMRLKHNFDAKWNDYVEEMEEYEREEAKKANTLTPEEKNAVFAGKSPKNTSDSNNEEKIELHRPKTPNSSFSYVSRQDWKTYGEMTEEEIKTYNFILAKSGFKKAEEYLTDLTAAYLDERYNFRLQSDFKQALDEFSEDVPILGDAVSYAASLGLNVISGGETAMNLALGNKKRSTSAYLSDAANTVVREKIPEGFLRDSYDAVDSTVKTITNSAVYGGGGIFTSTFASGYNNTLDKGGTVEQAVLVGAVNGGIEWLSEKISLGNLKKFKGLASNLKGLTKKQATKELLGMVGKQALVEGSEETVAEVANILTDVAILGYLSDYAATTEEFYEQGFSFEEAKSKARDEMIKQVGQSAKLGALSGSFFGGIGGTKNYISYNRNNKLVGTVISKNADNITILKELALKSDSNAIVKAAEKLTKTSKPSQVGNVYNAVVQNAIDNSVKQMTPILLENGATQSGSNSAKGFAEQIARSALNGENSPIVSSLLSNKVTKDVYREFTQNGEYGGATLLALNELATPAKAQTAVQGDSVSGKGGTVVDEQGDNRYTTEQTAVLEGFSNDSIKNAVDYHKSNGSDIPLHVLGISKGSSLYNALSAAGLINEDGTVNAKAIITEYNRRNGITDIQSDNTVSGFVGESGIEYTLEQAEVLAKLPIEAIQNATDYFYNTDSDIPLSILGITKESSLHQELEAAELTNEDGTVFGQALIDERARRIEERRKARKPSKSITEAYGERVSANLEKERPTPTKTTNKKSWLQKVVGDAIITNEARSEENESTNADILEGRKVSTVGRGKNRIRTHGANTEIIRRELGDLHRGEGNDDISLAAGETAWLSKRDFGPAGKMGGGLEKSFLRNIRRVVSNGFDSIGRKLSPELQAKVSDTVFMEENGTVFSFFHWSPNKFDEFKYGDGAFHCGTLQSALAIKNRSDKKVAGYIKEMYVISKNPFVLKDEGRFGAYAVAPQLEKFGIIDHNDLLRISQMDGFFSDRYDAEANVYVRGILESLGYDSYLYQNLDEDGGAWSVGVFNPDQIITIAENGVLKENSGVFEADSIEGSAFSLLKKSEEQHSLTDTEYMAAVKKGNTETQEKIVADAAKSAGAILDEDGNPLKLYRGAKGGQKVFSKDTTHNGKIYTTNSLIIASNYSDKSGKVTPIIEQIEGEPATYVLYGFPKKMLTMDAQALPFSDLVIPEELQKYSPDSRKATNAQIAEWAEQEGYDALHIKDVRDGGPFGWNDQYIFFDANLVKSADVVTKDNNGNIIPPSERFDESIISDSTKQNKSFDKTGSNDGSVSSLPKDTNAVSKPIEQYSEERQNVTDTEDVNADADVQTDNYAKEDKYWEAENENEKKVSKSLFDKIKNLFSHKNTDGVVSIGEIVKQIEKDFGVPVSTGRFKQKAYGIYKKKTEAIRTKVTNALPTIAHEVGHHLDKRYGFRKLSSISEAIQVLKNTRPDFYKSYPAKSIPGEAVAEFIRDYLADRALAKNKYPKFYAEFESALLASNEGKTDLENLNGIGDMINRYFVAEKQERARAALITRAEAKRRDRRNQTYDDVFTKVKTNFVDEGEVLKKVSNEAHDLYDYSLKTFVRVQSNIEGDNLLGFDGEKVHKLDKNGQPIKDENGNNVYMPALTHLFDDIRTKAEEDAFELYLTYKHGLEFLASGKRVFADDTINNKEYLTEEIKRLEAENPNFKGIAESVYEWQRAIMYEYGVKSGLMKKETAEALWQKYPCYVPFNRDIKGEKGGKGKVGFVNQSSPVRNAKGSGLGIFNIYENIILKTQEFMLAADRNAVMQEIANTVDVTEGFGYLLEKVPPQQAPVKVSADGTKYTIKNVLLDRLDSSDANALYNELDNAIGDLITDFQISNNQGLDIVSVYRNGERTYYQVHDKNLLKALLGLNKTQLNTLEATVGKATRLFKVMTTGGNPVWSITSNAPRDFSSAYKYSIENNPLKYTLDYFKAVYYSFSSHIGKNGKHTNEYLKLYKALGGGYNSSYSDVKNLRYTVKNIIKLDKTMPQKVAHMFNIFHHIGVISDAIETAPRLAEFKRVLEKTGDKQKALLAADNITVNFNRRGSIGKNIDQFLPYFNASIQGTAKYFDNLMHNKSFRVKTIVTTMFKVALLFSWNMVLMGDDGNDEYEKLSAYKKNNFYNLYMGNGKFLSIPKAKDTAYFESLVERLFEAAFKEEVDWGQEVQDFAAYTWLCFGPPLNPLEEGIVASTVTEISTNKDFKGSPIVPSAYEELAPELQYDENTTWVAYGLGQLFGWSPMQIDHVIDSNLGWIGLINRSLFKMSGESDWSLGVETKFNTDNAYSSDILNHFYDNAEQFETKAKSYPDDGKAAAKNKQYSAAKSVISALNAYGKDDETAARDYRIMARDYADNFEKNTVGNTDKRLISLYERTRNSDIFADKTFDREYSIDKVKYIMEPDVYLEYVDEYYSMVNDLYNDILSIGASDEMTALMLTQAKQEITDILEDKYKTDDGTVNRKATNDWRDDVVDAIEDNVDRKKKNGDISSSEKRELKRYLNGLD